MSIWSWVFLERFKNANLGKEENVGPKDVIWDNLLDFGHFWEIKE